MQFVSFIALLWFGLPAGDGFEPIRVYAADSNSEILEIKVALLSLIASVRFQGIRQPPPTLKISELRTAQLDAAAEDHVHTRSHANPRILMSFIVFS